LGSLGTAATNRPIVPDPGDYDDWQGKPKYSEKTFPSAVFSTTNPTRCTDAAADRRGRKSVSNRLCYGTAM
jgi:hypothetical protein